MFLNSTVYPQRTKPRVLALIGVLRSLTGGMGGGRIGMKLGRAGRTSYSNKELLSC
jgi:hypothetical protein